MSALYEIYYFRLPVLIWLFWIWIWIIVARSRRLLENIGQVGLKVIKSTERDCIYFDALISQNLDVVTKFRWVQWSC